MVLCWGSWAFISPFLLGHEPYFTFWWFFAGLTMSATPSLFRLSDARLSHSPGLLPVLLAQNELRRSHAQLVLVGNPDALQRLQPVRDFLAELGVCFSTSTLESLQQMEQDS